MARKITIALFLALCGHFISIAQPAYDSDITVKDLKQHISFLASDALAGRFPGTPGSLEAARYIRDKFGEAGLELLFNDGFQEFEPVLRVKAGSGNRLGIQGFDAVFNEDFAVFPFSMSASVSAPVVFAGYGFELDEDSLQWHDYESVDVRGKWVMILRGDPDMDQKNSPLAAYGEDRDKVIVAKDKGAAGVMYVSGNTFDEEDGLVSLYFDKSQVNAGIPVLHVKRHLADRILAQTGDSITALESRIRESRQPATFDVPVMVKATTDIILEKATARNVAAVIRGSDPEMAESYVVIGAHYDHLGMGGTQSGSRLLDSTAVHNGADDNASGTAGLIELAQYFSARRSELKRSLLLVAFDGEEQGLLGSHFFVRNPPVPLSSIEAMFNFDMIGRMDTADRSVMIGGSGTSLEAESMMNKIAPSDLRLKFSPEGYGPSDHAAFYAENIPVFFISTGAHEDYHMPEDDWTRINYAGEKAVLDFAASLVRLLASGSVGLTFQEAGPRQGSSRGGYRFKVTLGIMPDVTASESEGMGVGGVRKDGPAYKAGILKGDVIVAMDGEPVRDVYEYMNRLQKLRPGQVTSVDVLRDGKKLVLIVQL
jgi:hypothetical protein